MRIISRMFGALCVLGVLAVPAQAQYHQQQRMPAPPQRVQPHYNVPQQRMVVPQQRVQPHYAVPQQRMQPRYAPQMHGGNQRQFVQPHIQQQRVMLNQQHVQRAQQPAFNRHTGQWGQRMGRTAIVAGTGAALWYSLPDYDGPAYVNLPGVGMVEMDDRYESMIYPDLASGDPDRVASALALIEGSAIVQGLMENNSDDEGEEGD